jgi:hypothetical protein
MLPVYVCSVQGCHTLLQLKRASRQFCLFAHQPTASCIKLCLDTNVRLLLTLGCVHLGRGSNVCSSQLCSHACKLSTSCI